METRRQFELMRPESLPSRSGGWKMATTSTSTRRSSSIVDKKAGVGPLARVYTRRNKIERDVVVAFLLDMSASTDEEIEKQRQKYDESEEDEDFHDDPLEVLPVARPAPRASRPIEPPKRIIDLEKESTVLIVEALEAIGDSYGIYGFSGYGRDNVEFHVDQGSRRDVRRPHRAPPYRQDRRRFAPPAWVRRSATPSPSSTPTTPR